MRIAGFILAGLGLLYATCGGLGYYITSGTKMGRTPSGWEVVTDVAVSVVLVAAGCLLIRSGRSRSRPIDAAKGFFK